MKITHCNLRTRLQTLVLTAILAISGTALRAQTVTISPKTGNVIQVASYGSESALTGYGGAWIHNQMPLNLYVSDEATLTPEGLMAVHANNISSNSDGTLNFVSGSSVTSHISVSLPKGYRFTSYKMVFEYASGTSTTMSERDATFQTSIKTATTVDNRNKTATLERTASQSSGNTMGNVLYFYHAHGTNSMAYIKVTSFQITFECDDAFTETLCPSVIGQSTGVDCLQIPFSSKRIDNGKISYQNKAQRYTFTNVTDLMSSFNLYDNDGISGGTATPDAKKNGHINTAFVGGNIAYALQNDTYWLEVPTEAKTQGNTAIPLGYRITGAKLHYSNKSSRSTNTTLITIKKGDLYMNASRNFTSVPFTWEMDNSGYVWSDGVYLKVLATKGKSSYGFETTEYNLITTGDKSSATKFTLSSNRLSYKVGSVWSSTTYYVSSTDNFGALSTSSSSAATVSTVSVTVPSGTSSYTLKLYDKEGTSVAAETKVDASNASGTIEVTGLNNDAIKFDVSDLAGNAAYVYAELTLEALNPYIAKTDVVATVKDGTETLAQSYLADDFTIGEDGEVSFSIPDNFASDGVQISFDNLTSKNADDTYGPLKADGNSRYHFVKSDYYELIGENLQNHRSDAANHDYKDKVKVAVAGDKQFTNNNGASLATSTGSVYYEEYRYTHAAYQEQGGKWVVVTLGKDESKDCYLVTCDETRYNIAPTTTPRHAFYAFYNTKVKLAVQDYEPALTYTKVYNSAVLATGLDNNAYYGVKVGAKMKNSTTPVEAGTGYLFAKQILDQINADAGKDGCPKDAKHLLYVDASDLNTVLSSAENVEKYGKMELIQNAIGPNAMIYLPAGVTYTLKNVASKSASGDFKAENDIILVDKQPFFAPYDIRVDANNYTQYTREVTSNYGKSTYLTLVLPFTVDLSEDGTHTNAQGGSSFQFYNMQLSDALSAEKKDNYNYEVKGHFTPVEGSFTESNKPYLVNVLALEENADDNTIFVVRQNGASIVKTPTGSNGLGTPAEGETANGKIGTDNYTFTQYGTFNGEVLDGKTADYFYFAKNRFLASYNLDDPKQVYMMPFRTYYKVSGTNNSNIATLEISFDPNGESTGIEDLNEERADSDFSLSASNGTLTITANKDGLATVRNLNGQCLASLNLSAGQSGQVTVPAGIYLVNGIKVLIK